MSLALALGQNKTKTVNTGCTSKVEMQCSPANKCIVESVFHLREQSGEVGDGHTNRLGLFIASLPKVYLCTTFHEYVVQSQ